MLDVQFAVPPGLNSEMPASAWKVASNSALQVPSNSLARAFTVVAAASVNGEL